MRAYVEITEVWADEDGYDTKWMPEVKVSRDETVDGRECIFDNGIKNAFVMKEDARKEGERMVKDLIHVLSQITFDPVPEEEDLYQ